MELKIAKYQKGYLLIVAIILIVIVGFISGMLVNMYVAGTSSVTNMLQSDQALYIAKAGLEIVRRDLLKAGSTLQCGDINYSNVCYPPGTSVCSGYFSVTGAANNLTPPPTLVGDINDTTTSITVSNASGLSKPGVIVIENEAIWYTDTNSANLVNVKRGAFGTTASDHTSGKKIIQNICALTSTAAVPSATNPGGSRTLQEILWKTNNLSGSGLGTLPGEITPTLVAAGSISFTGSSEVHNFSATLTSSNFPSSNIVSGGPVVLNNNARTKVSPTIPKETEASKPGALLDDISENNNAINLATLWGYFFTQAKTELYNTLLAQNRVVTNCATYNFANASGTLWLACDNTFNPTGGITIGSASNPVILIVTGNINSNGNATINGLLYVMGCLSANGSSKYNGAVVVEGAVNSNTSDGFYFDAGILATLGLLGSKYNSYYVAREVFH